MQNNTLQETLKKYDEEYPVHIIINNRVFNIVKVSKQMIKTCDACLDHVVTIECVDS